MRTYRSNSSNSSAYDSTRRREAPRTAQVVHSDAEVASLRQTLAVDLFLWSSQEATADRHQIEYAILEFLDNADSQALRLDRCSPAQVQALPDRIKRQVNHLATLLGKRTQGEPDGTREAQHIAQADRTVANLTKLRADLEVDLFLWTAEDASEERMEIATAIFNFLDNPRSDGLNLARCSLAQVHAVPDNIRQQARQLGDLLRRPSGVALPPASRRRPIENGERDDGRAKRPRLERDGRSTSVHRSGATAQPRGAQSANERRLLDSIREVHEFFLSFHQYRSEGGGHPQAAGSFFTKINQNAEALERACKEARHADPTGELHHAMVEIEMQIRYMLECVAEGLDFSKTRDGHKTLGCLSNGLKALATHDILNLPHGDELLTRAFAVLLKLILRPDLLSACNSFALANLMNGLKDAVERKVIERSDEDLKAAFTKLIGMINAGKLNRGNAQDISNTLNGLKAAVEQKVIEPSDKDLKAAFTKLIRLVKAGNLYRGDPQEIANGLNGLKAAVEQKVIEPNDEGLKAAFTQIFDLINAGKLDDGIAQGISNALNGLKAAVEEKVIEPTDKGLKAAFTKLIGLINLEKLRDGKPQEISNALNGLKAAVEKKVIESTDKGLKAAFTELIGLINDGTLDDDPQHISNALNGLKAAVEEKVILSNDEGLKDAFTQLIGQIKAGKLDRGEPQHISNALNGLKAAVEEKVIKPSDESLKAAFTQLFSLIKAGKLDGDKAQGISNALNGLKAAVEEKVIEPSDESLKAAFTQLFGLINDGTLDRGSHQDISNALNGLKAAVEEKVIAPTDEGLKAAFTKLIGLINDATLDDGNPQNISNALNGLKAAVEEKVLEPSDEGLKAAFTQLIGLIKAGKLDGDKPQGISNALNGLKAAVQQKVIEPSDEGLQGAFTELIGQINAGKLDRGEPQQFLNALNSLQAAVKEEVIEPTDAQLQRAARCLFAQALSGGMDAANSLDIRIFLQDSIALEKAGILKAEWVQAQTQALLQRCQNTVEMAKLSEAACANNLALLMHFMRTGRVDAQQGWQACQSLWSAQPAQPLLEQGVALYRHWRKGPRLDQTLPEEARKALNEPHATRRDGLIAHLVKQAQAIDWKPEAQGGSDDAQLRQSCLQLHTLYVMLGRHKGRKSNAVACAAVLAVLKDKAIPALVQRVRERAQAGEFDATNLEMQLARLYAPDEDLSPPHEVWSDEKCHIVAELGYELLEGPPRSMAEPDEGLRVVTLDRRGHVVKVAGADPSAPKRDKVLERDISTYTSLFGKVFGPPIMVQMHKMDRPQDMPAYLIHEGRWYRMDLFRGSANKEERNADGSVNPPQLIGVPVEAAKFFTKYWFTSKESRCYAQRAFLAEEPSLQGNKPKTTAGLKGSFQIAVVADKAEASAFAPGGPYAHLRVKDGCGFIHEDLARQLLGEQGYAEAMARSRGTPPVQGKNSLPPSALQYYRPKAEEQAAITPEFLAAAQKTLGQPLAQLNRLPDAHTLFLGATMGKPTAYNATVVPAAGDKVVVPNTREWRALQEQGVLMGRAPYDTQNVLVVPPEQMEVAQTNPGMVALQYSLSGYTQEPGAGPEGQARTDARMYKGLLVIVPREHWPADRPNERIALSSKDMKMHTQFTSLESKTALQNPAPTKQAVQTHKLNGCLVVKDVRTDLIAVPAEKQDRLAGDYDGDQAQLVPLKDFKETAKLIERKNMKARGSPKMPKTFTRDENGVMDMNKLVQLQGKLMQDGAVLAGRYHSAPKERQQELANELVENHVLEELFEADAQKSGKPWYVLAGLGEEFAKFPPDKQARRLIKRELEIIGKAGTDFEKTELDYDLLNDRRKEYKKAMSQELKANRPWGKGVEGALSKGLAGPKTATVKPTLPAQKEAVAQVLGKSLDSTVNFGGLPNAIVQTNSAWFLGREQFLEQMNAKAKPVTEPKGQPTELELQQMRQKLLGQINAKPVAEPQGQQKELDLQQMRQKLFEQMAAKSKPPPVISAAQLQDRQTPVQFLLAPQRRNDPPPSELDGQDGMDISDL